MYMDEFIRIGFAADGGFLISYDRNVSPDPADRDKKDKNGNTIGPYMDRWVTRFVPDAESAGKAIEGVLAKVKKPKPDADAFAEAFNDAVKSGD